ncbi:MAG: hypothetical protein ACOC4C_02250 [Fibrobacterota bacterium]
MVAWIRRFARLGGLGTFFMLLLLGVDLNDPFDPATLYIALIKAFTGGLIVWMASFVVGDIIFKGVVEDIPELPDDDIEGGLLQQVHTARRAYAVDAPETANQGDAAKKKKNKEKKK